MTQGLNRSIFLSAVLLLAASGCGAPAVPSVSGAAPLQAGIPTANNRPADNTSVLEKLTKDVVIGSTVDSKNGDQGPRAISIAPKSRGVIGKGQLVVCNFEDSAGVPGNGTTMELLSPKASSKPVQFVQSDLIKGCDGDGLGSHDGSVYGSGLTSGKVVQISRAGKPVKTYSGKSINAPFADTAALPNQAFSPQYIFVGTTAGGIVSISVGFYGNGRAIEVADGFPVSKGSALSELAPSGLQYDPGNDVLYVVDGANNTVVAFSHASDLLDKDEVVVEQGGKKFKCLHPKTTCASLVYSGSPLNAPVASALLPNGNLIVANSGGTANTLVELTPQGKVLDTKVVDQSSTQGVFGLAATGKTDSNTVLFYTDTNTNTVHELEH